MSMVVTAVWHFFRGIQLNVLHRPRTRRQLMARLGLIFFVIVAAMGPFLIQPSVESVTDVASGRFLALLNDLDQARAERSALRRSPQADPAALETLELRIADLEEQTFIGYIKRDGDAAKEGALVPDFRLLDLDGNPVHLSALGKPAIINFWASWCPFCIEEMPDFQRLHAMIGDRVTLLGINRAESLGTARRFTDQTGVRYTVLLDLDDDLGGRGGPYQIIGMPTTLYVRADGRIDTVKIGFHSLEEMAELAGNLLGEKVELETGPVDTSFAAGAGEILASQRANHAVASELLARFTADPSTIDDLAWQRNIAAQTRAWVINLDGWRRLTPFSDAEAVYADVTTAFELLETAAGLLVAGILDGDPDQVATGAALFDDALPVFNEAAENLLGLLATF